ncbi:MAG: hypothetical protein ACE5GH_01760 [Fidelibacterota bacterium]
MSLVPVFFRRRLWIRSHQWLSDLALSLVLPVILYLSIVLGFRNVVKVSPDVLPFQTWVLPGIMFIIVLVSSYFPVFADLFENRKFFPFYESISASPNSGLAVVTALAVSLLPDVILKTLVAGIILQFLGGSALPVLPFIGFFFFVVILGFLIINLALSLTLLIDSSSLHLSVIFILLIFLIVSSGWIIPLEYFPDSLSPLFAAFPTSQLMNGGRALLFHGELTLFTWLIPLVISLVWLALNSIIFVRVNTR